MWSEYLIIKELVVIILSACNFGGGARHTYFLLKPLLGSNIDKFLKKHKSLSYFRTRTNYLNRIKKVYNILLEKFGYTYIRVCAVFIVAYLSFRYRS